MLKIKRIPLIILFTTLLISSGFILSVKNENLDLRMKILNMKFRNSDVKSIEIIEIEHPMLGGIVNTIKLNKTQQEKFLSEFDKLQEKGLYKCRTLKIIRINLKSDTLRLKICGNMVSNRNADYYYELSNNRSLIDDYTK